MKMRYRERVYYGVRLSRKRNPRRSGEWHGVDVFANPLKRIPVKWGPIIPRTRITHNRLWAYRFSNEPKPWTDIYKARDL